MYQAFPIRYLALLFVLGLGVCLLVFVWPTRYRYDRLSGESGSTPLRIDRLTGQAAVLTASRWKPLHTATSEGSDQAQELPASELALLAADCSADNINWINCNVYNGSNWTLTEITAEVGSNSDDTITVSDPRANWELFRART